MKEQCSLCIETARNNGGIKWEKERPEEGNPGLSEMFRILFMRACDKLPHRFGIQYIRGFGIGKDVERKTPVLFGYTQILCFSLMHSKHLCVLSLAISKRTLVH